MMNGKTHSFYIVTDFTKLYDYLIAPKTSPIYAACYCSDDTMIIHVVENGQIIHPFFTDVNDNPKVKSIPWNGMTLMSLVISENVRPPPTNDIWPYYSIIIGDKFATKYSPKSINTVEIPRSYHHTDKIDKYLRNSIFNEAKIRFFTCLRGQISFTKIDKFTIEDIKKQIDATGQIIDRAKLFDQNEIYIEPENRYYGITMSEVRNPVSWFSLCIREPHKFFVEQIKKPTNDFEAISISHNYIAIFSNGPGINMTYTLQSGLTVDQHDDDDVDHHVDQSKNVMKWLSHGWRSDIAKMRVIHAIQSAANLDRYDKVMTYFDSNDIKKEFTWQSFHYAFDDLLFEKQQIIDELKQFVNIDLSDKDINSLTLLRAGFLTK